jgi:hypothetical protein
VICFLYLRNNFMHRVVFFTVIVPHVNLMGFEIKKRQVPRFEYDMQLSKYYVSIEVTWRISIGFPQKRRSGKKLRRSFPFTYTYFWLCTNNCNPATVWCVCFIYTQRSAGSQYVTFVKYKLDVPIVARCVIPKLQEDAQKICLTCFDLFYYQCSCESAVLPHF